MQPNLIIGKKPKVTFLHVSDNLGSGTSKSVSSVPFGAESSDRIIIVSVHWALVGTATVNSITCAGISALGNIQQGGTNSGAGLWYFRVPSGASGTINFGFSSSVVNCDMGVWSLTGYKNAAHLDSDSQGGPDINRAALVDTELNGVIIAAATSDTPSPDFTGITTNYNQSPTFLISAGGSLDKIPKQANYSVSKLCRAIVCLTFI